MSAFSDLKERLSKTSKGWSGGQFYQNHERSGFTPMVYSDTRTPVEDEIRVAKKKANIDASLAATRIGSTGAATNARSAFAAGRATRSSKLFKRGGSSFGSAGKLEKANIDAASNLAKEAAEFDSIDPDAPAVRQRNQPMSVSVGAPIRLW